MFGYVTAYKPELKIKDYTKYRAFYCGLCRVLREKFGLKGQLTLSYDMTFLIVLLSSLYEPHTDRKDERCIAHPLEKRPMFFNEITEYVADINIILSYYHLIDDWQDEKSGIGLAGTAVLKRSFNRVVKKYPNKAENIRNSLDRLNEIELSGSQNIDAPAGCFGDLMADIFAYREDIWEEDLRKTGFYLGKFIYIMDAYDDLEKDIKAGSYNPLKELFLKVKEPAEDSIFEKECNMMLTMMMAECTSYFEKLPCVEHIDILRNILYAGVWNRYDKIRRDKYQHNTINEKEEDRNDK